MLGLGTTNPLVDLEHLVVGGLLAYAGSERRDAHLVRGMVGGVSVLYLLAFVLGFVVPALFGMLPDLSNGIALAHSIHAVLGVSGLAVVRFSRG